ncbi:MAG TPA: bifunctional [glutamate--ammonia ligase]-adenylyl-L-tyrosine phosphorylase/[glutamate--ammonia-ligase] adenylyltransferase [Burkholderiales bacterium]|nr:bifunctional [glutamate--ammonia ligase]-adenylyl-L-tyrosine phosphorylase/[glutamate--ammonia-ligase] adenylyltransferase [Burkholderiales bacterium]
MPFPEHPAVALSADPLRRAAQFSRYARRVLERAPQLLTAAEIDAPFTAAAMRAALPAAPVDDSALWRALRALRERVMLRVIARDLGGLAGLDEVVATMTALAETAIAFAADHLERQLATQYGTPSGSDSGTPQKLHVVGMGKLGGRELNVSSDIDLVLVYPEEGETDGARALSNHEFFARLARRLIAALDEITADGRVFRVDLRLRPWGAEGALVCSFETLENYFVAHGREWERYAWIKARLLRGDRAPELTALVQPFVFRRYLDYSAFESLRALHREVRDEVERRDRADNIKLGPGGIREIEFIAQLFQLVRGGRDAALREPATLKMLPLLTERGLLPSGATQELTAAYVFLRNLEHRLQYFDDQQTQQLPTDAADQALLAAAMDCADYRELCVRLDRHRAAVTRHFDGVIADVRGAPHPLAGLWSAAADDARYAAQLRAVGYREPQRLLQRLSVLRASQRFRQMPEAGLERIERIVPLTAEAAARQPDPEAAFERLLDLLESISRREAYLALLLQYPGIIERSARLVGASPWAAAYLARHPILLDELLAEHAPPDAGEWPQWHAQLRDQLDSCAGDTDRQMDALRHFKHSHVMRLIVADLDGQLPLEQLSDHLSALADIILAETLRAAWQGLRARHRDAPRFAVVAYGKLGGKELDYASDLDLIFLYDDAAPAAAENYARLAQRLSHWLTSLTPAGVLYAVDLRLRPDGASGLLVSALDGFDDYQKNHAWTWEHQALTRARFVCGDAGIGARFEQLRLEVLCRPRDPAALRAEVVAMRERMLEAHPDAGDARFDLKHGRGGLVDVEFAVQYLVLNYAHRHPELAADIGNLALLKLAARLGLITEATALAAHAAYRRLRWLQHTSRLQGEKQARVEPAAVAAEIVAVKNLWREVFET